MDNRFLIDIERARIVKLKDDTPDNVPFSENYVEYSILFKDIPNLIAKLKDHGDIPDDTNTVIPKETYYESPDNQLRTLLNVQANLLDRQLTIIEYMLNKKED